jgi:hypothetical protein
MRDMVRMHVLLQKSPPGWAGTRASVVVNVLNPFEYRRDALA